MKLQRVTSIHLLSITFAAASSIPSRDSILSNSCPTHTNNIMSRDDVISTAQSFCEKFNFDYEKKHINFETQFWGNKMALSDRDDVKFSTEELTKTQSEMENFLANPENLKTAQELKNDLPSDAPENLVKTLDVIIRTCRCYDMSPSPDSKKIRDEAINLENELTMKRNRMKLGYTNPEDGVFNEMSSVGLRNAMRVSPDEKTRKAAYEGLRSLGPFITENGFPKLVKLRNKFAKSLGFSDFYDYKVSNAEGFGKTKLFEILDGLEQATNALNEEARKELERRHGKAALEPWNTSFMMAGDVIKKMDPFFPFNKAVERYLRSYSALGVDYAGSTMNLDLLDRKNKYSNGFCHWPKPAWVKPDGSWQPATANFTSLADPSAVGSGLTALTTLMHEAGHAAHFANIKQPSPLFSQERAPTSVAYAENQSMFLDSLVSDAAWRAKYALDAAGNPVPFDIIQEEIMATHPFKVFQLRGMLVVSYFEKALYELSDDQVTAENIQKLADEMEQKMQGGFSPRPLLCVPHIISDEASCYYHGYTLAEMSVHQTRNFFLEKYGYIVDNPEVGPTLTKAYWECGNSRPFLEIVKDLTGKELSGDDWVKELKESVEDVLKREEKDYKKQIEAAAASGSPPSDIDLNMTVRFVDGDTLIADSSRADGGLLGACKKFEDFVSARINAVESAAS